MGLPSIEANTHGPGSQQKTKAASHPSAAGVGLSFGHARGVGRPCAAGTSEGARGLSGVRMFGQVNPTGDFRVGRFPIEQGNEQASAF